MRILLAGHRGQLGRTLLPLLTATDEPPAHGPAHTVLGIDLPDHDISDRAAMLELARTFRPDLILNAAAMTDVDGCARNPELAYRVNGMGTQNLALAAAQRGRRVHADQHQRGLRRHRDRALSRMGVLPSNQRLRTLQARRRVVRAGIS